MKKIIFPILVLVFLGACKNESDVTTDKADFNRIYDNSQFSNSYYPIDIAQTPDGGFLIIGGRKLVEITAEGDHEVSNFSGVYLLKVDELGNFVSDQEVDSIYVDPVGPLISNNGSYYFFSMNATSLQTQLIQLSGDGTIGQIQPVARTYPLAAGFDNGNFLLLSYNKEDKESVVSVIGADGSVSASKGYTIGVGDAVEAPLINHFTRNGRQYPFQVGKTLGGKYFFNGFYNYTFSLVFTDLAEEKPNQVQGTNDNAGLNQVVPLSGDLYATSRFDYGENYLLPQATLSSSSISSSVDLNGNSFPELVPNAPIKTLVTTLNGKEVIVYGSNTRSRQIALYAYEKATGIFLGSKYLGFSNPYEIGSMVATADGGIAVCGTTYVAGRFPRICLFKFSAESLSF